MRLRLKLPTGLCILLSYLSVVSPMWAAEPANRLVIYPVTEGMPQNADFSVKVRISGHAWRDVPTYVAKVAQGIDTRPPGPRVEVSRAAPGTPRPSMGPRDSSFASFDFSGSVDVSVTYSKGDIETARIRPLSYAIAPSVKGNTITFSLSQPRNISVEVNGDIFQNLQLFANPLEVSKPDPNDPNVIYYGPGAHQVGRVKVPSGTTVYLEGGALVEGQFLVNHAENVQILGRGILHQLDMAPGAGRPGPPRTQGATPQQTPQQAATPQKPATSQALISSNRRDAILIEYSKNVDVDGIIEIPTSYTVLIGQSQNIAIRNIKSISAGGNNDGIDVFTSSDVLIDGVFMRNSDDNIAIYGHRWNYYGDTKNVTVQNSTLWADVAHPILVGTHGDTDHPDTLEDMKFLNLDILDQREPQIGYQGCMSLNAGDSNLIRKIRFEDIRVEDIRMGELVNLRVFFNKQYNTSPGRGIEDVLFKNVTYSGTHASTSIIAGYDDARGIKNVVFEDLSINGRIISDDMPGKPSFFKTGDMADIFVGEHVDGVVYRTTAAATPSRGAPR